MPDEPLLREQARTALRGGTLPNRKPDRVWGGPGVGAPCALCRKAVTKDQMEFEIEFAHGEGNGNEPGLDKFHIHVRCFAAWELERTKVEGCAPGTRRETDASRA